MTTVTIPSLLDFTSDAAIAPMTENETKTFLHLMMAERRNVVKPMDFSNPKASVSGEAQGFFDLFQAKVFTSRMAGRSPDTKMTVYAAMLLITLSKSPGDLVMWAFAMHRLFQQEPRTAFMLDDEPLAERIITVSELANTFPMGFPTEESKSACWEAQKCGRGESDGGTDNFLDGTEVWALKTDEPAEEAPAAEASESVSGSEPSAEEGSESPEEKPVADES